jgi:hypothetical protein
MNQFAAKIKCLAKLLNLAQSALGALPKTGPLNPGKPALLCDKTVIRTHKKESKIKPMGSHKLANYKIDEPCTI